jgi:hypothetical protein
LLLDVLDAAIKLHYQGLQIRDLGGASARVHSYAAVG